MNTYDDLQFGPLLITEVFETYRQSPAWLNIREVQPGKPQFPQVTNSADFNSIAGFVAEQKTPPNPGNAITIGIDTQVAAYQPVPFYGATKVLELRSPRLTEASALILVASLKHAMQKFSWGHKASAARLKGTRIMVPVTQDEEGNEVADWDGMKRLGQELTDVVRGRAAVVRPGTVDAATGPPQLTFIPMLLTEVFASMRASQAWYDKAALKAGDSPIYPYVSRTRADNGVEGFCNRQEKSPEDGNAITIGLDTQTVGYQAVPFYTGQNIQVLRHPNLTVSTAAVLMTVIKTQLRKFSWGGNGATLGRLKVTKIMVPVTQGADGSQVPDWAGMEQYGRWLTSQEEQRMNEALRVTTLRSVTPV